jgi:hypothetical protein
VYLGGAIGCCGGGCARRRWRWRRRCMGWRWWWRRWCGRDLIFSVSDGRGFDQRRSWCRWCRWRYSYEQFLHRGWEWWFVVIRSSGECSRWWCWVVLDEAGSWWRIRCCGVWRRRIRRCECHWRGRWVKGLAMVWASDRALLLELVVVVGWWWAQQPVCRIRILRRSHKVALVLGHLGTAPKVQVIDSA